MKRITDRSFHYTPSFDTDIRRTFARLRAQQAKPEQPAENVRPLEQLREEVATAG